MSSTIHREEVHRPDQIICHPLAAAVWVSGSVAPEAAKSKSVQWVEEDTKWSFNFPAFMIQDLDSKFLNLVCVAKQVQQVMYTYSGTPLLWDS